VYTGEIAKTRDEMSLEELLIDEDKKFHEKTSPPKTSPPMPTRSTKIKMYDQYDGESQKTFQRIVSLVSYIHKMKVARARTSVVAICGPRDSGKTTLLSQLLHRPEIAVQGAGLTGGEKETQTVTPYLVPNAKGYAILDTPGLSGPDETLRNKFNVAALNLASTFVYLREYKGLPTETDVNTIQGIMQCAARSKTPSILVCLNCCKEKLTKNAAGEIFHLFAETEASNWLAKLQSLRPKDSSGVLSWVDSLWSRSCIEVKFVELGGGKELEHEFSADDRTKGIWTASSIGKWISRNVTGSESDGDGKAFQAHLENFDYKAWQKGVRILSFVRDCIGKV
jgi:50S ribosome-binding GTPase